MAVTLNGYNPYDPDEIRRRQLLAPNGMQPEQPTVDLPAVAPAIQQPLAPSQPQATQPQAQPQQSIFQPLPESPEYQNLNKVLGSMPHFEDYHPSTGRRVLGAILGGLAGGGGDGKQGAQTASDYVNRPFNHAMAEWQASVVPAEKMAGIAERRNSEQIQRTNAETSRMNVESNVQTRAGQVAVKQTHEHNLAQYRQMRNDLENKKYENPAALQTLKGQIKMLQDSDPELATEGDALMALIDAKHPQSHTTPEWAFIDEYRQTHPGAGVQEAVGAYSKMAQRPQQPPQMLGVTPDNMAINIRPGVKVPEGTQTMQGINSQNTTTSQGHAMAEMAGTVQPMIPNIISQVDRLASKIGPGAGRWNNFWVNKAGMDDPDYAGLDTDLDLFSSALVRTHFGARGGQEYRRELKRSFSLAQSPEDLKSRIMHAEQIIKGYADIGKKPTTKPDAQQPFSGNEWVNDITVK